MKTLAVISIHANKDNLTWVSMDKLAEETQMSKSSVYRAVSELIDSGIVVRTESASNTTFEIRTDATDFRTAATDFSHACDSHPYRTEKGTEIYATMSKISNERQEPDDDGSPGVARRGTTTKLPRRAPDDGRLEEAAARHLAQLSGQIVSRDHSDRANWKKLIEQYGAAQVEAIITECWNNKAKVLRGDYAGANITSQSVVFYAKTFYKPPAVVERTATIDTALCIAQNQDGTWDERVLANVIVLSNLRREDLRGRVDDTIAERVFAAVKGG